MSDLRLSPMVRGHGLIEKDDLSGDYDGHGGWVCRRTVSTQFVSADSTLSPAPERLRKPLDSLTLLPVKSDSNLGGPTAFPMNATAAAQLRPLARCSDDLGSFR